MAGEGRPIWIRAPLAVFAKGAEGGVVVRGPTIAELVPAGGSPQTVPAGDCEVFDASGHVLVPGLVNSHHHFYQTLTRALPAALDKQLFPWLTALYPVWAGLDPEMIALSTRLALAELLLSGCTTACDHHYLYTAEIPEAVDIEVEAAGEIGIRVVLTRGSMSLSEEDGGLPPRTVVQAEDAIMADCERVVARYHQPGRGAMVQIALAPCAPWSVSEELMRETAAYARANGVRLHTHLAETRDETGWCLERFGKRPLQYLEDFGWLGPDVWLAHGIHFDDDEVRRLGETGTGVAHCPTSNLYLASGTCRVLELEAAGAPVGVGVDGSSSNDCSNLMQEVRQAMLVQKHQYGSERVSHADALRWATSGSARVLGRDDIGRIAAGAEADLALFRLDEPRFSGHGDPLAALVVCGAHRADRVMVAGRWRVVDGAIPGLDLDALIARHSAAARRLRDRAASAGALRF